MDGISVPDLLSQVAFPIIACLWLMFKFSKTIEKNTAIIQENTRVTKELSKSLKGKVIVEEDI